MIYSSPGATFTSLAEGFPTGLTGTIGVRIENTDGTTHTARTTSGIVELEAASGSYTKANLVAPTTRATYIVLWDSGSGQWASEELAVTSTGSVALSGSPFATPEDIALRLGLAAPPDSAELLLTLATAVITESLGKSQEWADTLDPVPEILRGFTIELVCRALASPQGATAKSESLGAYSYSESYRRDPSSALLLTKAEELVIRRAVYGRISDSVVIGSHFREVAT